MVYTLKAVDPEAARAACVGCELASVSGMFNPNAAITCRSMLGPNKTMWHRTNRPLQTDQEGILEFTPCKMKIVGERPVPIDQI